MTFDYKGDFEPCPTEITIYEDSMSLNEIAQQMYQVAKHPVRHEDKFIAGKAVDAELHKPRI